MFTEHCQQSSKKQIRIKKNSNLHIKSCYNFLKVLKTFLTIKKYLNYANIKMIGNNCCLCGKKKVRTNFIIYLQENKNYLDPKEISYSNSDKQMALFIVSHLNNSLRT